MVSRIWNKMTGGMGLNTIHTGECAYLVNDRYYWGPFKNTNIAEQILHNGMKTRSPFFNPPNTFRLIYDITLEQKLKCMELTQIPFRNRDAKH